MLAIPESPQKTLSEIVYVVAWDMPAKSADDIINVGSVDAQYLAGPTKRAKQTIIRAPKLDTATHWKHRSRSRYFDANL
jgi:hypothetical protein